MSRRTNLAATTLAMTVALLAPGGPAQAAAPADKPAVLSAWTQTTATSYAAWNGARLSPAPWTAYAFDWTTDYCTSSPDQPSGFDFRLSCQRHDFGYRNYEAAGGFASNKVRLDDMFYGDLSRKCDSYNAVVRPACDGLAWTYYQAAKKFGAPTVSAADLQRADQMKRDALNRAMID
ncbi:phospholipase [Actinoplanes sp. TRM88002]|uniref:Phospholipase n=2 Tax=Paractinoplanes hotanensis TaxID=2906497 RepID=A0ABT0YEV5_9ACTN|nr:phospholipase [Actinoplanes hotanensis]